MKSFPLIVVAISAVLSRLVTADVPTGSVLATISSTTSGSSSSSALTLITSPTRRLDDDKPWDNGTKVYKEFPDDGWWSGTITSYSPDSEMYTVTWEDGSTDYFDDDDTIDKMVAYAQNDPLNNPAAANVVPGTYPTGTAISMFEDGTWYDGQVVNFISGTYTVKWNEDGAVEQIQAGAVMDQMVTDGNGDDDAPPAGYERVPSPAASANSPSSSLSAEETLPVGTPVSSYEDGEWSDGTITGYSDNMYIVMWEDGSTDNYFDSGADLQELKQAAEDAFGDDDAPALGTANAPQSGPRFPIGTVVSDFEEGEWVDGQVVDFKNGNYIVQWDDEDDVEYYASSNAEDMQELQKMSENGIGDDDAAPAAYLDVQELWDNGTRVAVAENNVWYMGSIVSFSKNEYTIDWDDGETEVEDDLDFVNQMVADGATHGPPGQKKGQKYEIGQTVYTEFQDSEWYVGHVIMYNDDGFYTVRWSDGDNSVVKRKDLKTMVKAARYIPDDDDIIIDGPGRIGMSAAWKAFLSIIFVAVCAAGSVFGYKFYEKRQVEIEKRERELSLEDGDAVPYRDQPSELPKII